MPGIGGLRLVPREEQAQIESARLDVLARDRARNYNPLARIRGGPL